MGCSRGRPLASYAAKLLQRVMSEEVESGMWAGQIGWRTGVRRTLCNEPSDGRK